jgi:subtilisin family serine protease
MAKNIETQYLKVVPATQRFVASNRRAGKQGEPDGMKRSRESFEMGFSRVLARNVTVLAENENAGEAKRGIRIFDADYLDLNAMKKNLPSDVMIEPLITRKPAIASAFNVSLSASQPLGKGTTMEFYTKDGDKPLAGVCATLNFVSKAYPDGDGAHVTDKRETDAGGRVVFEYDGNVWLPVGAVFQAKYGYWASAPLESVTSQTIQLKPLPMTGPLGWWHYTVGISNYDPIRGSGIKIGVVDTGLGPNPWLNNVKSIGSFIDGRHDNDPESGRDSANHGTHVCGIIAALQPSGSIDYVGIVPGADVYAARVFPKDLGATQADIANAVDALASEHGVHLINMSLGSEKPSAIELDAIRFAMEHGTLCICAAGNDSGGPVSFPAAYNETVAVSGLGLLGVYPPDTLSAWFTPNSPGKFGKSGLFLASYSNVGNEIVCCAPGTGIISTVPGALESPAPYLAMDGTSMSTPMVTATLAACLAGDGRYKAMPGNLERFRYAAQIVVVASSNNLNLIPQYQGYGMTGLYPLA